MTHRLVAPSNEIYTKQTPCSIWASHRFQILCNTSRVSSLHLQSVPTYCICHDLCLLPKSSNNCTFLLRFYALEVLQTWIRNAAWMLSTQWADIYSSNPSLEQSLLPCHLFRLMKGLANHCCRLAPCQLLCFGGIQISLWHHVMYCITRQPYWI